MRQNELLPQLGEVYALEMYGDSGWRNVWSDNQLFSLETTKYYFRFAAHHYPDDSFRILDTVSGIVVLIINKKRVKTNWRQEGF